PASLADSTAPTVAASIPGQPAFSTPPPLSDVAGDPNAPTISASAAATPQPPGRAPSGVWPAMPERLSGAGGSITAFLSGVTGALAGVWARHRSVAIAGAGAVLLLALVIAGLAAALHSSARISGVQRTPTAHVIPTPTVSPTPVETIKYQDALN